MNSVGRKCCAIEYFVSNTAESLLASNNFLDMQVGIVYYWDPVTLLWLTVMDCAALLLSYCYEGLLMWVALGEVSDVRSIINPDWRMFLKFHIGWIGGSRFSWGDLDGWQFWDIAHSWSVQSMAAAARAAISVTAQAQHSVNFIAELLRWLVWNLDSSWISWIGTGTKLNFQISIFPASLTNFFLLNVENLQLVYHAVECSANTQDSEPLRCLALQGIRPQINWLRE